MHLSRRRFVLATPTVSFAALSLVDRLARAAEDGTSALFAKIDEIASKAVEDQLSVGIAFGVAQHGDSVHSSAHGIASVESNAAISPDAVFRIASVTKVFVAIAAMKLVEEKQLRLADKLDTFFDSFPVGKGVSVYNLLSHTSGLKDWWELELPTDLPKDFPLLPRPHAALARCKELFHFSPGSHHWYSNTGFVLLGEVIEKVTSAKLEDFVAEAVLKPAGLTHTSWVGDDMEPVDSTQGHHRQVDPTPHFQVAESIGSPRAAGGLLSSANDLLKLADQLFTGKLLAPETVKQMSEMATLADGTPLSKSTWHPSYVDALPELPEFMQDSGWGLGVSRFSSFGKPVVWHSGGIPGFNAIWLNFPSHALSFAMLANTDNGAVPMFNEIVPLISKL